MKDLLVAKEHQTLTNLGQVLDLKIYLFKISHQNKHQNGQDVEDSITKQRPPAQRDRLEKTDAHTHTHCTYKVESDQANGEACNHVLC